jgi:hypothetical protein
MRLNNWSIAASYDTTRIAVSYEFAGLGFGSSTASRSIICAHAAPACVPAARRLRSGPIRHFKRRVMGGM